MKKDIALVLSSGGARGFAHIGAIKVLVEYGFNIRSVAGTSMGALVGGIYATGMLNQFEDWVCSLDKMEVLKLTDLTVSRQGLVRGEKIIGRMKEIVPDAEISRLPIPFCAVATDILKGKEHVFTSGSLYDAIRASISIPTVFLPFRIEGDYFVDGGVVNPIPVNRVVRHEGDLLAAVNVNSLIPFEPPVTEKTGEKVKEEDNRYLKRIRNLQAKISIEIPAHKKDNIGIFNLTNRSIGLMLNQIASLSLAGNSVDIMVEISKEAFGTYDFYKASEIISEGERATRKALESFMQTDQAH